MPLVILGLVAGAAILLIAGYGAPVGVGLVIGLGLGGAVGLVGVLWIGAGPGRSVNLGSFTFSSELVAGGGSFELPDWMRDSERVIGVDLSPLRQIVVLGQRAEAAGVTVEFTTLELREAGGVAWALVHTPPPNAPLGFARPSVTDDLGSSYVAATTAPAARSSRASSCVSRPRRRRPRNGSSSGSRSSPTRSRHEAPAGSRVRGSWSSRFRRATGWPERAAAGPGAPGAQETDIRGTEHGRSHGPRDGVEADRATGRWRG